MQLHVQLASSPVLGGRHARARLSNVLVEEQGDELLVIRYGLADAFLGASAAAVVDADERDLVKGRGGPLLNGHGRDEADAAEGSENEGVEKHLEGAQERSGYGSKFVALSEGLERL